MIVKLEMHLHSTNKFERYGFLIINAEVTFTLDENIYIFFFLTIYFRSVLIIHVTW